MTEPDELADTKAWAEQLGCSTRKVERDRTAGTGCAYLRIGGLIRYRLSDRKAYLEACRRNSTSEPEPKRGTKLERDAEPPPGGGAAD
jgi:hypothetical protein